MPSEPPILIATRGSALALAQANHVLAQCRAAFPKIKFDLKIIKTTGDKLQTVSLSQPDKSLPKGLFTKELEVALLKHRADLAVHSLKDLPTELPAGLILGAVGQRADVRDVLIYRDAKHLAASKSGLRGYPSKTSIKDLPKGATIGTSSTRRKSQIISLNPGIKIVDFRGNVGTRLQKIAEQPELDAIVLAAAGLARLGVKIGANGKVTGDAAPDGLLATILEPEIMLPCVGQGAIGIEIRDHDERIAKICERLNHLNTQRTVTAERAFLSAMGGGCQSPVGAYAEIIGRQIRLRAVSFVGGSARYADGKRPVSEAAELGWQLAKELHPQKS